jgi:pilus assembly protein Flp/PilA
MFGDLGNAGLTRLFGRFVRDERGATAVEYALIAAVVAMGIIASLTAVRGELNESFTNVESEFNNIQAE